MAVTTPLRHYAAIDTLITLPPLILIFSLMPPLRCTTPCHTPLRLATRCRRRHDATSLPTCLYFADERYACRAAITLPPPLRFTPPYALPCHYLLPSFDAPMP